MMRKPISESEVFFDASYAIALSAPNDQYHMRAEMLAEQLEAKRARLITRRAVVPEIGNMLAKERHRSAAIELLCAILLSSRKSMRREQCC